MSSPVQASRSRGAIVTDIQMGLVDSRFDMHPIRGIADGPLTVKACFVLYAKPIANKAHSKSSNYQLPPKQTKGPARKRPSIGRGMLQVVTRPVCVGLRQELQQVIAWMGETRNHLSLLYD